MPDSESSKEQPSPTQPSSKPAKSRARRKRSPSKGSARRSRTPRIYPALSFEESLVLAEAIHTHASGERVARLTLLKHMNLSPTSSATQILITSSGKYGLTKGSYVADHLELTPKGRAASDRAAPAREKARGRFDLAIAAIEPFNVLYERYRGKKLPSHDVMHDVLKEAKLEVSDYKECTDTFVVNVKFLGLLQTIAGSETLVPVETYLEQLPSGPASGLQSPQVGFKGFSAPTIGESPASKTRWQDVCFYISPIGEPQTEHRKHADMFLSSLIEPALEGFNLTVVRADRIGQPGMITTQILEHILRARLVIVDISYHNPNVFYEMAVRHVAKLPIVQICRKADRIPFDVNQVRTIEIDTTDIYTLVPKLETYQSEIASVVRAALEGQVVGNPVSIFFPGLSVQIPKET